VKEDISFGEMKEEFLEEILQIYNYYVKNTTASFHVHTPTLEEMRDMVFSTDEKYKTYIIKDKKQICGYVYIHKYSNREAYDITAEVSIYLQQNYIKKGIGSTALNYIENHARQHGIHSLLAIICGQNEASIRLCSQNGYIKCAHFKEVGEKFGQLLDIVAYQKIIN
jgi:phosphinothricin acetyltransferase